MEALKFIIITVATVVIVNSWDFFESIIVVVVTEVVHKAFINLKLKVS